MWWWGPASHVGRCSVYRPPLTRNHPLNLMVLIERIISGGQSGADRAALDFAIERGIPHGGWCPRGRKAEDGPIDPRYRLRETPSTGYAQRTLWNVRDSDGTVIFTIADRLKGGSRQTAALARKHCKPCLHLASQRPGTNIQKGAPLHGLKEQERLIYESFGFKLAGRYRRPRLTTSQRLRR